MNFVLVKFLLARVAWVAVLLLAAEAAFRAGVWEPLAKPDSHAGASIALKRVLREHTKPIDYVTLGNSRAQWGFDHAELARLANAHGRVHANLSMGGEDWMTMAVLARWLERERPEVRGGLVISSVQEFLTVGHGNYELALVYPLMRWQDAALPQEYVPIDRQEVSSFGSWSALFQYRSDLRDYLVHHETREQERKNPINANLSLFDLAPITRDICAAPTQTWQACTSFPAANDAQRQVVNICKSVGKPNSTRADMRDYVTGKTPVPEGLAVTRDHRRQQLRALRWKTPPLVVLMPVHRILENEFSGQHQHEWALSVLQPLVDEGVIRLADYTQLFDLPDGSTDCRAFFDFFHLSAWGRAELMKRLSADVEEKLYRVDSAFAQAARL